MNIRVRGRTVTFATGVTLFALLPFLGGSAPQMPRASVVLAAGASAAAAPQPSAPSLPASAPAPSSGSLSAVSGAIGGGLFMFPDLAMSPDVVPALSSPVATSVSFIRPVPGPETSPFGPRIHPVMGVPMFHTGLDLSAACGTPIRAAASGTVVYAQVSPSWGARTIIQHSASLKTAYGHQSKFLVKEGDVVKQGDIIGLVGTTGWSTGCHLHFDVILNDRYVDPAPYLGLPSSHAPSIPFRATPHVANDEQGIPVHLVEDGDAPVPTTPTPKPVPTTSTPSSTTHSTTGTPVPTTTDPTTTDATTTPPPTTSDPTTTTDPTTTAPTTTTQAAAPAESTSSSTAAEPTSQPSTPTSADPAPAPDPTGTGGSTGSSSTGSSSTGSSSTGSSSTDTSSTTAEPTAP